MLKQMGKKKFTILHSKNCFYVNLLGLISNFGQQFRKSCLKIFLFLALAAILFKGARLFVNLGPYEEHFCEIILNWSQQVRG